MTNIHVKTIRSLNDLYTFTKQGVVKSSGTWSETNVKVSSSGGGGSVMGGYGHISAPTVSSQSTTTEVTRFFVGYDNGMEDEITLKGADFSVREGHRLTLVYGGSKVTESGFRVAMANHTTGRYYIDDEAIKNIYRPLGCAVWLLVSILFCIVWFICSVFIVDLLAYNGVWMDPALLAGTILTPLVAFLLLRGEKNAKLHRGIKGRVLDLIKEVMKQG